MKGTILLDSNENTKKIEEEEKIRYLKNILEQMGVPIEEFWDSEDFLSVKQKIQLLKLLSTYHIQIIDDSDGHMEIYVDNEKVAQFNKPIYKLKRDLKQLDPRKQLYLEMEISCEDLFEEAENK